MMSGYSGGAVLLLSLLRRRIPGPTLPSLLLGAADDGRRLAKDLVARLDSLRIRPPLLGRGSVMLGLLVKLCGSELLLALRFRTDSGSWNMPAGTWSSSSRPRIGSGEAWMELLLVMMAVSGDMMGDPCRELEPTDDALRAEMGAWAMGALDDRPLVWT
jgi:hypothetical protein